MNESSGGVVFLFPGEGGEHDRMGRMLAGRYPVFADAVTAAGDAITAAGGPRVWTPRHGFRDPVTAAMVPPGARPDPAFVQPALFAYQVATAQLLISWGVRPDAVVGHGLGEAAAAVTAGALSLTDAARIATARGRALSRISGTGAVAELLASANDVARLVEPLHEKVAMAAVNGPRSVLISGSPRDVETVVRRAERRGIATAHSAPDYPAHSHRVIDAVPEFLTGLGRLDRCVPHTRFYSSTRPGTVVDAATAASVEYWGENITRRVDLDTTLRRAAADGMTVILEVCPAPVLAAAVRAIPPFTHTTYPTADHDDEGTAFLTCLAQFHATRALGSAPAESRGGAREEEPHRPAAGPVPGDRQAGTDAEIHRPGHPEFTGIGYGAKASTPAIVEREALRRPSGSHIETASGFPEGRDGVRTFRGEIVRAEVTGAGTLASIRLADDPPPTDIIAWTRMVDANRAIRFMSGRVAVEPPMEIDRAGTYVVSGGLGALGSVMVRRLLAAGARDVVVPTRSPRPVPPLLEGFDDRVVVVRCDTADRLDLDNALRDIRESGCTIRGVVHAAQVFEDTVVGAAVSVEHTTGPGHRSPGPGGTEEPALDAGRLARRFARISVSAANLIELTAADPVAFIAVFATPIDFTGPYRHGRSGSDDTWMYPAAPG